MEHGISSMLPKFTRFELLLMGRKDIFEERFSLEIDSKKKVTVIKRNH